MAEQIVATDDDDIFVNLVFSHYEMQVADCAELVGIVSALIINDRKTEFEFGIVVSLGPVLEMFGELFVRDDVRVIDVTNATDLIEHMLEHRLARNWEQRLRLIQR